MIEQHVTSLEISQRLKSLSVKQLSEFYWQYRGQKDEGGEIYYLHQDENPDNEWSCSAFLASELAEMLPKKITVSGMDYYLDIYPQEPESKSVPWVVGYNYIRANLGFKEYEFQEADTLPNALGKMLIHLIENHLIETSGVLAGEDKGEQTTHQA